MAKKTKLSVAVNFLQKIARTQYKGITNAGIIQRLRGLAEQGLAEVEALPEEKEKPVKTAE